MEFLSQSLVNEGRFPQIARENKIKLTLPERSQSLVNEGRFPLLVSDVAMCVTNDQSQSLVNEGRFPQGGGKMKEVKVEVAIPR
mgnify:CR=1 FL=1